jgi:hypothetical protein
MIRRDREATSPTSLIIHHGQGASSVSPVTKTKRPVHGIEKDEKFWEELICLLSLHKLTVNNIQCHHLLRKIHPNPPIGSKVITVFLRPF